MRRAAVGCLLSQFEARFASQTSVETLLRRQLSASTAESNNTLIAELRSSSGSAAAAKLRKRGRVPGILFSLPGEQSLLLSFDLKQVATQLHSLGRTGWACHVFDVQVPAPDGNDPPVLYKAVGRQVHLTAATDEIENVTLLHCPPDRIVRVNVPLRIYGEEICPGLKAGGRINWIVRKISCIARGDVVPVAFEVDISALGINDKLLYNELQLPEGVELAVKDPSLPMIKIMKK